MVLGMNFLYSILYYANEGFKIDSHTFLYSLRFWYCTMELILDELQKNNVDIDMRTLSYHTSYLLKHHEMTYNEMVARVKPDELSTIFSEMNVNNFGRAMAFLTYVYVLKGSEDVTRCAVRLVAVVLKDMDLTAFKVEEDFFKRMLSGIRRTFAL